MLFCISVHTFIWPPGEWLSWELAEDEGVKDTFILFFVIENVVYCVFCHLFAAVNSCLNILPLRECDYYFCGIYIPLHILELYGEIIWELTKYQNITLLWIYQQSGKYLAASVSEKTWPDLHISKEKLIIGGSVSQENIHQTCALRVIGRWFPCSIFPQSWANELEFESELRWTKYWQFYYHKMFNFQTLLFLEIISVFEKLINEQTKLM